MKTNLLRLFTSAAMLALAGFATSSAHAQWLTQTITLKPGWNAVYLHVDPSHDTLDNLVGADANSKVKEIWLWQPPVSTMQFTTSPQQPTTPNSQWAVWDKSVAVTDTLTKLISNAAYLVNNTNTADYVWSIKGKPVPPRYQWTTTGLNFIGFPTPAATSGTLDFDTFLGPAPTLQSTAEIYRYPGGNLGSTNPVRVFPPLFRNTFVKRGEAFWIRSGTTYNRYYGPVEVNLQNPSGMAFASNLGTYSVRLKNVTSTSRTVTMSLVASESVPVTTPAQTPIVGTPPMLIRGAINMTNLTYPSTTLVAGGSTNFVLAPQGQSGSELEVVLGLNRSAMGGAAGSLYAGVLRFADSGNLEQVDVPVTATVGDTSGLWVGAASVTSVNQYLKTYASTSAPSSVPATNAAGYAVANLPGYTWTAQTNPPVNRAWQSVASSTNGTKLVAVVSGGQIYTSTDSGSTWTARMTDANRSWQSVASSHDGTKLLAAVTSGQLYTSADSGVTWTARETSRSWQSVTSSADGTKLMATLSSGTVSVYTSTDGGGTWVARTLPVSGNWVGAASSADGTKLAVAGASGNFIFTSSDSGATWTQRATSQTWQSITSSTDGSKLAATVNSGNIYASTDSGANWASLPNAGSRNWRGITSSADGSKLAAVVNNGQIWISTDSGASWTARESSRIWNKIASSADGLKLLASHNGGQLYTSSDSGTNWVAQNNVGMNWQAITSSADGTKLVKADRNSGQIWTSGNSGVTWTARDSARAWQSVASSTDGTKLVAAVNASASAGYLYTSTDSGATWTERVNGISRNWSSVASSADGTKLVGVVSSATANGNVFVSNDSGVAWTQWMVDANRAWSSVASSSDGSKLVAAVNSSSANGYIYTSTDSGVNWTARMTDANRNWTTVASSTNGMNLVAAGTNTYLNLSKDAGLTWANQLTDATRNWQSVAISADGSRLVAAELNGALWMSLDGGLSWEPRDSGRAWSSVAMSADGTRQVASVDGDQIYTTAGQFINIEIDSSGRVIARTGTSAPYLATGTNTAPGAVARAYPLRLILHNNAGAGSVNLLQRVYYGQRFGTNTVIATQESFLDAATIGSARRISDTHLPFSHTNRFWPKTSGTLSLGGSLVFSVNLDYNDHVSNPFLHTYHPDHDNLKSDFKTVEVQGAESYTVTRQITLAFTVPATDFASLTAGSDRLGGTYTEAMTFSGTSGNARTFTLGGTFIISRISSVATLTTQ